MSNKLINLNYAGSRHFFKGIIEQGAKLADWSYCQMLVATRLGMKLVIGGVEQDVVDGRTLLDLTFAAAKQGKFTDAEAEAICAQLDRISLRFTSVRTPFFASAYEASEGAVEEKELTVEVKEDIISPELKDEAVEEAVEKPKAGRKAKAK
jgi:hypothetical protein